MTLTECLKNLAVIRRCRNCGGACPPSVPARYCTDRCFQQARRKRMLRSAGKKTKRCETKFAPQKKKKKKGILEFARDLQINPPKSDKWFQNHWEKLGMKHFADRYNEPAFGYIPDCVNHIFKYIIEVDGSIHNLPEVQKQDNRKTRRFNGKGYIVFRIPAYDLRCLLSVCGQVEQIRSPKPAEPVVILRKAA